MLVVYNLPFYTGYNNDFIEYIIIVMCIHIYYIPIGGWVDDEVHDAAEEI